MGLQVDWQHGANHIRAQHQITVQQAHEALADPDALLFAPDPKGTSGQSARLIGYSPTAAAVLVSSSSGARTSQNHGGAPTAGGQTAQTAGPMRKES